MPSAVVYHALRIFFLSWCFPSLLYFVLWSLLAFKVYQNGLFLSFPLSYSYFSSFQDFFTFKFIHLYFPFSLPWLTVYILAMYHIVLHIISLVPFLSVLLSIIWITLLLLLLRSPLLCNSFILWSVFGYSFVHPLICLILHFSFVLHPCYLKSFLFFHYFGSLSLL